MSGSRTNEGDYFYTIHKAMKHELEIHVGKYKYWRDYYKEIYDWFPEFHNDLLQLKQVDESLFTHYLNNLNYSGLTKISLTNINHLSSHDLPVEWINGRIVRLKIPNDSHNIILAGKYLYNRFLSRFRYEDISVSDYSTSNPEDIIANQIFEAGLKRINDLNPSHAKHLSDFIDAHGINYFERWAMLIIYAQSTLLPFEPGVENFPTENIYMDSKGKIQELSRLENRCGGASRILIVNYAGTSFLAGKTVTDEVESAWSIFLHNLLQGQTKVDVVLTDPNTPAARDAEKYKMRPYTLKIPLENIISENIRDLENTMKKYIESDIHLYLTDISLPCAYLKAEFKEHPEKDNIKIDLYLPSFAEYSPNATPKNECDDELRQSFIIFRKTNPKLYDIFSNNMERILEHSIEYGKE